MVIYKVVALTSHTERPFTETNLGDLLSTILGPADEWSGTLQTSLHLDAALINDTLTELKRLERVEQTQPQPLKLDPTLRPIMIRFLELRNILLTSLNQYFDQLKQLRKIEASPLTQITPVVQTILILRKTLSIATSLNTLISKTYTDQELTAISNTVSAFAMDAQYNPKTNEFVLYEFGHWLFSGSSGYDHTAYTTVEGKGFRLDKYTTHMEMFKKFWQDGKRRLFVFAPDRNVDLAKLNGFSEEPLFLTVCTTTKELKEQLAANTHPNPLIVSMVDSKKGSYPIAIMDLYLKTPVMGARSMATIMGADKYAFHVLGNALFSDKFPSPPTMCLSKVTSPEEIDAFVASYGNPAELVLKPIDGTEGLGVIIGKATEIKAYVTMLQQPKLLTQAKLKRSAGTYHQLEELHREFTNSKMNEENAILLQVKLAPTPEGTLRTFSVDGNCPHIAYMRKHGKEGLPFVSKGSHEATLENTNVLSTEDQVALQEVLFKTKIFQRLSTFDFPSEFLPLTNDLPPDDRGYIARVLGLLLFPGLPIMPVPEKLNDSLDLMIWLLWLKQQVFLNPKLTKNETLRTQVQTLHQIMSQNKGIEPDARLCRLLKNKKRSDIPFPKKQHSQSKELYKLATQFQSLLNDFISQSDCRK